MWLPNSKCQNKNEQHVITIYCWITTVTCFTMWTMSLTISVYYANLQFVTIFTISVYILLFTYYGVKCVRNSDTFYKMLDSIQFVDESLTALFETKVPHETNTVYCILCTFITVSFLSIYVFEYAYDHTVFFCYKQEDNTVCFYAAFVRNTGMIFSLLCLAMTFF